MSALPRFASLAALLTACSAQPPTDPGRTPDAKATSDAPPAATDSAWIDAGSGLSLRIGLPPGPHKLGATLEIGLEFRNDTAEDMRVYLIETPIFRALQSEFTLFDERRRFLDLQPEPHPHGYVVRERDFRRIPPGAAIRHSQPLLLDPERIGAHTDLTLQWTYKNKIESWAGGVQTLDGPTQALFGGGRIPGIWLGEVQIGLPLQVAR